MEFVQEKHLNGMRQDRRNLNKLLKMTCKMEREPFGMKTVIRGLLQLSRTEYWREKQMVGSQMDSNNLTIISLTTSNTVTVPNGIMKGKSFQKLNFPMENQSQIY